MIRTTRRQRAAFALVEVVVSTLVVAVMLVAAMRSLGSATRWSQVVARQKRADLLASELMSEVVSHAYREPSGGTAFGRDAGESSADRSQFDDVDDYHLWQESPPVARDGSTIPNLTNWSRSVRVEYVNPADPAAASASDQGAKRITVGVYYKGVLLRELTAWRTDTDLS